MHYSVKGVGAVQVSPVPEKGDDSGKSDDFAEFDQDDDVEVEETGEFEDLTSNQQGMRMILNICLIKSTFTIYFLRLPVLRLLI